MELLFMERKRIMDRSFYKYVDTMKNLRREKESADVAALSKHVCHGKRFTGVWDALLGKNKRGGPKGNFPSRSKPVGMSEQEKKVLLEQGCGDCDQKRVLTYLNSFQSYGYKNEPVIDLCTQEVFSSPNLYYTDGVYEWDLFEVYDYAKYNRELNRNFISYLKEKENREYSNIVFGLEADPFSRQPGACPEGKTVLVDRDGCMTCIDYGGDGKIEEVKCQLPTQVLSRLQRIMDAYSPFVDFLDRCNEPQDGRMDAFIFNGTRIQVWNIRRHHIEFLKLQNTERGREELALMQQQNLILEIFEKACVILNQVDLRMGIFEGNRLSKKYAKTGENMVE